MRPQPMFRAIRILLAIVITLIIAFSIAVPLGLLGVIRAWAMFGFKSIQSYLYDIVIGIDIVFGTIIYRSKNHTVSYETGKRMVTSPRNLPAFVFGSLINLLYGEGHCQDVYLNGDE